MVAPTTWSTPSGDVDDTDTITVAQVSHAGGYWFAVTRSVTDGITVRYSTSEAGPWATATMPTEPATYNKASIASSITGVVSDGTSYAILLGYTKTANPTKYRVVYCTDPSGTWTAYEYDATDLYRPSTSGLAYADSTWIISGRHETASPQPGFIATCSTVAGTYTFYTSASDVGYNTADLSGGGTQFWLIGGIVFDGSTWVSYATRNTGDAGVRTSSSLITGWSAPSSPPSTDFTSASALRLHGNGYWTVNGSNDNVHYTTTPSGTWTNLTEATMGFYYATGQIAYANGYWIATGTDEDPSLAYRAAAIHYVASSGAPTGTWLVADANFTDVTPLNSEGGGLQVYGNALVAAGNGELRYCLVTTAPTYLRQRQSEVRSPSRVRGIDLRQRQTNRITG